MYCTVLIVSRVWVSVDLYSIGDTSVSGQSWDTTGTFRIAATWWVAAVADGTTARLNHTTRITRSTHGCTLRLRFACDACHYTNLF